MTIQDVLRKYDEGQLTASHAAVLALDLITEENGDTILSPLPPEVAEIVQRFVAGYHPGRVISINGAGDPGAERVGYARRWFAARV